MRGGRPSACPGRAAAARRGPLGVRSARCARGRVRGGRSALAACGGAGLGARVCGAAACGVAGLGARVCGAAACGVAGLGALGCGPEAAGRRAAGLRVRHLAFCGSVGGRQGAGARVHGGGGAPAHRGGGTRPQGRCLPQGCRPHAPCTVPAPAGRRVRRRRPFPAGPCQGARSALAGSWVVGSRGCFCTAGASGARRAPAQGAARLGGCGTRRGREEGGGRGRGRAVPQRAAAAGRVPASPAGPGRGCGWRQGDAVRGAYAAAGTPGRASGGAVARVPGRPAARRCVGVRAILRSAAAFLRAVVAPSGGICRRRGGARGHGEVVAAAAPGGRRGPDRLPHLFEGLRGRFGAVAFVLTGVHAIGTLRPCAWGVPGLLCVSSTARAASKGHRNLCSFPPRGGGPPDSTHPTAWVGEVPG